jgi:aspartate kinase
MVEFARLGARVLHPPCVEFARSLEVTIIARSTFSDAPGTRVTPTAEELAISAPTGSVLGVTSRESVVALTGKEGSDPQRLVELIMTALGAGAEVLGTGADTALVLLDLEDHPSRGEVPQTLREALAGEARLVGDLCAVSVVCADQPEREFGEQVQAALGEGGLSPLARVSSERAVTVTLPSEQRKRALCILHQTFVGVPEPVEA